MNMQLYVYLDILLNKNGILEQKLEIYFFKVYADFQLLIAKNDFVTWEMNGYPVFKDVFKKEKKIYQKFTFFYQIH